MTNTDTIKELNSFTISTSAATLAVAYNAYHDARKERDDKLSLIWGELVVQAAETLRVTDAMLPGLNVVKDVCKHLRQTVTGLRS